MNALGVLMIIGCGGLMLAAALAAIPGAGVTRACAWVAVTASGALAAAGILAAFGEHVIWQPIEWFPFGHAGVHVDNLAGLFLILAGLVSACLFITADGQAPRSRAHSARCWSCA